MNTNVDSGARVRTTNHTFDNLVLGGDEVAFVAHQSSDENTDAPSIIDLMAQGLKDEVVARRIGMGSRTFRRHMSSIMDKLGASSRFQAGVVAARVGLIGGKPLGGAVRTP
ncbi:hypothetical protein GCM10010433_52130 [Streptomyces pulveraceus]|uniref:Response regulator transcription factor n=1 Tax=Streptomyces pulveraceus TaxID=68258 RepID=A0ABW1GY79_9ACTN